MSERREAQRDAIGVELLEREGGRGLGQQRPAVSPLGGDGSLEAIARLTHAGYRVVIATNQSGIGRGLFDMATLNAIHEKMHKALALVGGRLDALFYCPHTADSQCECRKPKTGMLREIGVRYGVDMTGGRGARTSGRGRYGRPRGESGGKSARRSVARD